LISKLILITVIWQWISSNIYFISIGYIFDRLFWFISISLWILFGFIFWILNLAAYVIFFIINRSYWLINTYFIYILMIVCPLFMILILKIRFITTIIIIFFIIVFIYFFNIIIRLWNIMCIQMFCIYFIHFPIFIFSIFFTNIH
jgi:hypothetical protein